MLYRQNLLHGAFLILSSELMFASMGAAVKAVSVGLPTEVVVFMRNLMGLFFLLPLVYRLGPTGLSTTALHLHMLRALVGVSAMYCFFYALSRLPLADGMLLKMTAPIFMPVVAYWWLKETAPRLAILAVPVGLLGVALVLKPEGDLSWAALVGLLGGFLAAIAKVTVRRLSRTEPTVRVVFYFGLNALLISAVPLAWAWQTPTPREWALLAFMGLTGTLGQLMLTRGYAVATASQASPFTYFSVLFGAGYGYLFWGELLDLYFVAGALLIGFAGLLAVRNRRDPKSIGPGGVRTTDRKGSGAGLADRHHSRPLPQVASPACASAAKVPSHPPGGKS